MALKLENTKEFQTAKEEILNDNTTSGWLLLKCVDADTLRFHASGTGGIDEIAPHLEDNQFQYGIVRLPEITDKATQQKTTKDVFFYWNGSQVEVIEKEKKQAFLEDAKSILQPFHTDITVMNKELFNEKKVLSLSNWITLGVTLVL